jgi:15-cis-phytoene synthase
MVDGGRPPRAVLTAEPQVLTAYRHCEQVTRSQARNFAYGIALLPTAKRRALSAVYAFARRIDDIGDGDLPAADKLAGLEAARADIAALQAAESVPAGDQVLFALRDAARRYALPLSAFAELIDGCEADVRQVSYPTFGDLEHYCRCVAGSIGRLSLAVFGSADMAAAAPLADALGVALQLTNILRDVTEDFGNGRVYLPADDLGKFGCALEPGGEPPAQQAGMTDVIRFEAERARDWYARGLQLMPLLDWRSAASAGTMAGIYFRLLDKISAAPQDALAHRMSLPTREKAAVAAKALSGLGRRRKAAHRRGGSSPEASTGARS